MGCLRALQDDAPSRQAKRGQALIAAATEGADPREVALLEEEMRLLTEIGNEFRIRHHETTVAEVSDDLAEQLFARMFAFVYWVHGALCHE